VLGVLARTPQRRTRSPPFALRLSGPPHPTCAWVRWSWRRLTNNARGLALSGRLAEPLEIGDRVAASSWARINLPWFY